MKRVQDYYPFGLLHTGRNWVEVALPLGGLGVDVVGVMLEVEVMGKGEIDGELRWYPEGWDQRSGPVEADNYQVLSRGLVRDRGVLKFSVGDEDEPMEAGWKAGGLVAVVRGVEQGVDKLGGTERELQYGYPCGTDVCDALL